MNKTQWILSFLRSKASHRPTFTIALQINLYEFLIRYFLNGKNLKKSDAHGEVPFLTHQNLFYNHLIVRCKKPLGIPRGFWQIAKFDFVGSATPSVLRVARRIQCL